MRIRRRALSAGFMAVGLLSAFMTPAFASHFRGSNATVSYSNGVITWDVDSAWRKDDDDDFFDRARDVTITDSNGNAVTSVIVGAPSSTVDQSNPLFAQTKNTVTLDVTALLNTPGTYQAYVTNCCRIGGVQNTTGNDDFSQAMSFTVVNGTVKLPPRFNQPVLYKLTPGSTSGTGFTIDYRATSPQGSAVTYALMTDTGDPDFGATALQCASFIAGILTISPRLCTGAEVYSTIYQPGYYFAVKVRVTDNGGNHAEVDTLLRVPTIPQPFIDDSSLTGSTASFDVIANDTVVDSFTVTCTNIADPTDVRSSAPTAASPVSVTGLAPSSAYNCGVSATNSAGTGSSDPDEPTVITTPAFVAQTITFPPVADTHLSVGHVELTATSSSGLPIAYTSKTPTVCTVSSSTVTLHALGTCTIVADQAGDDGYATATPVTQSFVVTPAAPAPAALKSTGVGSARQSVTIPRPTGGTVTLLNAANTPVTTLTIVGQGTYKLNQATSVVTFTPVLGFSGAPTPAHYRVTDAYGQTGRNTYTPTVTKPAAPGAPALRSTGTAGMPQLSTVTAPTGGSVTLLTAAGDSVNSVSFAKQGTYTLNPSTGVITFTPATGFTGRAPAVTYRVSDAYNQTAQGTLIATVTAVATTPTAPSTPTPTASPTATSSVTPTTAPTAALPNTGLPVAPLLGLAFLLLILGTSAAAAARPRKH